MYAVQLALYRLSLCLAQRALLEDPSLLTSAGDRKKRKQLFTAITQGDFSLVDDDDFFPAQSLFCMLSRH